MRMLGFEDRLYLEADHEPDRLRWMDYRIDGNPQKGFEWVVTWNERARTDGNDRDHTHPEKIKELFRLPVGKDEGQAKARGQILMNTTRGIIMQVENDAGNNGFFSGLKTNEHSEGAPEFMRRHLLEEGGMQDLLSKALPALPTFHIDPVSLDLAEFELGKRENDAITAFIASRCGKPVMAQLRIQIDRDSPMSLTQIMQALTGFNHAIEPRNSTTEIFGLQNPHYKPDTNDHIMNAASDIFHAQRDQERLAGITDTPARNALHRKIVDSLVKALLHIRQYRADAGDAGDSREKTTLLQKVVRKNQGFTVPKSDSPASTLDEALSRYIEQKYGLKETQILERMAGLPD